jgi:hypothetical protein
MIAPRIIKAAATYAIAFQIMSSLSEVLLGIHKYNFYDSI